MAHAALYRRPGNPAVAGQPFRAVKPLDNPVAACHETSNRL
jgi:hypothetical protein